MKDNNYDLLKEFNEINEGIGELMKKTNNLLNHIGLTDSTSISINLMAVKKDLLYAHKHLNEIENTIKIYDSLNK